LPRGTPHVRPQQEVLPGADKRVVLPDGQEVTIEQLNRHRWETGQGLEELLDDVGLELETARLGLPRFARMVALCARKIGKTWWATYVANKVARAKKNAIIRFAFPTKEQGKTIIVPLFEEFQETCPPDLRWVNREAQDGCWYLPHRNARLYLAGSDTADQIDRLRGPRSDVTLLDEFTFFHCRLRRLITGVLMPQLLSSGGNMICTGTPPESLDHESVQYIEHARKQNRLIKRTIFDNPRLSRADLRLICEEAHPEGTTPEDIEAILDGKKKGSPEWRREFLVELVSDDESRVTPEFDDKKHVAQVEEPHYCLRYVFIDPGYARDFFAATFGFLDFMAQRLVIRREYVTRQKGTEEIREDLLRIEGELGWREKKVIRPMEGSNPQQRRDFGSYSTQVVPKSPGKGVLVVPLKNALNGNRVLVDPSCVNLIAQLSHGIWTDKARADFKRGDKQGHLDLLDALATGIRMVNWRHNPAPAGELLQPGLVYVPEVRLNPNESNAVKVLRSIYTRARRDRAPTWRLRARG
jgi:hypothetical protein